ncbi:pleiotropic drug resistance ABC transporter [Pterulicium gracile]|uniref:Pleiotropic drug resistance ABC transporter n=1 Tax=Pterulicium gracile TaxID=1884261 RepID=A0A5C3QNP9_9AGAR|nr:pleiotropic drug resistance ABC transporter [Pterula gracilis]
MAETPATLCNTGAGGHSTPRSHHGVDVAFAEKEFKELERKLSQRPAATQGSGSDSDNNEKQDWSANVRTAAASAEGEDLEKGDERFDLREYLTASNDENQSAGIKHKHVGVTWEDLQVNVTGGTDNKYYVPTFADAVYGFFMSPILLIMSLFSRFTNKTQHKRAILHPSSGVLKPGEMCLVLGCPGSGCSTFLKVMANEREGYASIEGDVRYAGIDAETMAKFYKGEVVYNEEDDRHIATLTVAQTLDFALSTKTPGKTGRLPNLTSKEFRSEVKRTMLRMLNMSHTEHTLVGDEFVRGVSGGERKRVSIAEMMATRARVQCWDNSTRGLDASTALDFAKSLRIMTDVLGQSTFVTLYQAGEGIYDLFDKVLVIDKGRQVYFGSPKEARAYFEDLGYKSLPRQSTADYLTGCTDTNERQFAPGRSKNNVPSTPEDLERAFLQSKTSHGMVRDMKDFKQRMELDKHDQDTFRQAVLEDKKKRVSKKSPYTVSIIGQVRALTIRKFHEKLQDRFFLYSNYGLGIFLALVLGGAYFNLPLTSQGAFTRGSVIFATMLTICLDAFGEMPMMMLGRPIVRKQTSYRMYRPTAVVISNTLADIPFSFVRTLIFTIIVYFMSGLYRSAGAYFTFLLFNYISFLAMQGFFRTLGLLCRNFDAAFRIATFFLPNFIVYTGYMIPVSQMKRWLFWIYYASPLSYGFAGCFINEFMRISMICDGASVVPRNGPGMSEYPDALGENQACTLFGSQPGTDIIRGTDYMRIGYNLNAADLWRRNFLVIVGWVLLFQVTQILAIEYWPQYISSVGVNTYAKENSGTKSLNEHQLARKQEKAQLIDEKQAHGEDVDDIEKVVEKSAYADRKALTWEHLNYDVPVSGGTKRLLNDVFGYVKPGTLTALMGASGAGKTTCLDVLAQRKTIGVISGDVLVDGRPLTSDFQRGTAYAEQMDVHEGTATIREALRFSAYLRQSGDVPMEEKNAYVEEIIELLELQDLSEALVHSLSVEARKRLTIGVELASKPELLLFLDEPTSGLDAQSAWNLVRFLKKLANQGQAILCTIHQPSALLFESFDRLLLLERGGLTVYFGDIGADSNVIRDYYRRNGAPCPSNMNPAEFMLEAVGAGTSPRIGDRDWADIWRESPEFKDVLREIEALKQNGLSKPDDSDKKMSTYATSFITQLKVVVKRNNLALWRSPDYIFSRLFVHAFIALFVSLPFLQLGNSSRDLQYRVFGLFWTIILPAIIMAQLEPMFILNRRIFIRESSSRIYSPYVFAIGQLLGEIPYSILCAVVYWLLMVWPMGFGQGTFGTAGNGFILLIVIFLELFGVSLGQAIGSITPSIQVAVLFNPVLGVVLSTFCGVTLPYPTMETFWRSWLYELVPYTRSVAAIIATELHGLEIVCGQEEFATFDPPTGETCGSWADPFVNAFTGYLNNPDASSDCQYCQYAVGDEFFVPLNIAVSNRWRDAFILFAFFVFNILVTLVASRYLRFAKR